MLQKSQDRHKISFAFEFYNKNIKKVFGANLLPPPSPDTIKLDLPPDIIRVKQSYPTPRYFNKMVAQFPLRSEIHVRKIVREFVRVKK